MTAPLGRRAGTAVAWRSVELLLVRALSVGRFLVLARILEPADFGVVALAMIAVELTTSLTELGFRNALVQRALPTRDDYDTAWTIELGRAVLVTVALVCVAEPVARLFGDADASNVLRVVALRPVLDALGSPRLPELQRSLRFRALASLSSARVVTEALVAIVLAPSAGLWALVAGSLAAAAVSSSLSYRYVPARPRLAVRPVSGTVLFQYGRWVLLAEAVRVLGASVLRAGVSRTLGTADVGRYFLASGLAYAPNATADGVVWEVAFPLHAQVQADADRAARLFRATLVAMVVTLTPGYALLIVLAPSLVDGFLGPGWAGTVPAIQIIGIAGALGVVSNAVGPAVAGRGRPQLVVALHGTRAVTMIVLVWSLADRFGLAGAALAVLAGEVAVEALAVRLALVELHQPFRGLGRPLLAAAAATASTALVAGLAAAALPDVLAVVLGGTVGVVTAVLTVRAVEGHIGAGLADARRAFPVLDRLLPPPRTSS